MLVSSGTAAAQQQAGSIRGIVTDADFGTPLPAVQVFNVETNKKILTSDQGHYVFREVPPGKYTLIFSKDGYVRQVKADVVVVAGTLTDLDVGLLGEFNEMEEFVVQDFLRLGDGSEAALLKLRFESPSMMDSIGSELMSRAGASDAASALRLVAGASVQDGKFAVIRGLPDRYVSSQMNGVRLPTADEDKRAVELDQFPAVVIESLQVSKTFTPDQQGDASGGAVNLRLKGIPDQTVLQVQGQVSANSQVTGRNDFLTYDGGGLNFWGKDDGGRDIQFENLGSNWDGAVGVSRGDAPFDSKWSAAFGGMRELDNGLKVGGLASFFYERDSSFFDHGRDDSWWVEHPGGPMTPQTNQGTPQDGDFKTALFDVTQGSQSVQWGGLGTLGIESERHKLNLTYLYTHIAEDTATLAEDTRGKAYYFPGYDPNNPTGPGNEPNNLNAAPYLRLETLEYTERTTGTLQLHGEDRLPFEGFELGKFKFGEPKLEWTLSKSSADLNQPDKRQFGSLWLPDSLNPGVPPYPPFKIPSVWFPYKPGANFNLGNLQRIWKDIAEDSDQVAVDVTLPFEQWSGEAGSLKTGLFDDRLNRAFDQDTFSNFGDPGAFFNGTWKDYWSKHFPFESHPITASTADVDYDADQEISALYTMLDLPVAPALRVIGGARLESTQIGIVNDPEPDATWFPPGATAPVALHPGDADVSFEQDDVLPSLGLVCEPIEQLTLRSSYSRTVARQTFKELTPIIQQEYLGGPIFIGNPDLQMSSLENYDLRLDARPYEGGLISLSWFDKHIEDPIEYVQRVVGFTYTTPVNYPEGELSGYELEVRQSLGHFWDSLDGFSVGANGTLIDSEVQLPDDEIAGFNLPNIQVPITSRDMTNAPDHLYNLYLTYDLPRTGSQVALFYTVQGDTLVAGAGQANGNFVPDVYAKEYATLNLSLAQKLGKYFKLEFKAKNLTNPEIEEVYRSSFIGSDVTKTSYTKGIEYSLGLSAGFSF
jgi:outer membrane receptor protein involved in Fe transport